MAELKDKIKRNISYLFFVPTLRIDRDKLEGNNFVNSYLSDLGLEEQFENSIYLLFKPSNLDRFKAFVDDEYERTLNIIDDYNIDDEFVVLVYTLDDYWEKDFNLVKKGQYSRTSEEFQEQFPKEVKAWENEKAVFKKSIQYRIFNKTKDLKDYIEDRIGTSLHKDAEMWDTFEEKEEILDIEKIKQLL